MTEKQYGGQTGRENKAIASTIKNSNQINSQKSSSKRGDNTLKEKSSKDSPKSSFEKANQISDEIREFIKKIIKKDTPLLEIAEKIESEIIRLNGKPAFPTNLSINEIAAHYTPSYDDKTLAHGLLKVDFGVQVNAWTSDNAISFDLENSESQEASEDLKKSSDENKKLIQASEKALENAINLIKKQKTKTKLNQIGEEIEKAINSFGFKPIANLSGHEISQNDLHAGQTIPNFDNKDETEIGKGLKAIEPFSTTGTGKVHDGKPSGIYQLTSTKNPRSQTAREVLEFIEKEYKTLPFCSRWIYKKFQAKGLFALRELENNGNLHHFAQLVESGKGKVAQAERTVWVE